MAKELSTVFIFLSIGIRMGLGRQPRTEKNDELRVLNGTVLTLDCTPADYLVRTHMAPDFENPQLVRRLDWLHDEALVASYQQDIITDASRQWWVAGTRYELIKPFYQLRISPLLPEDSGRYKCRLETDPLFALDSSTSTASILVLVRPPSPSKPHVTAYTDRTVTLSWSQSAGPAHRPILRYSLLISQLDEENIRVLTTETNRTTITAEGLQPYTRYAFSVRAENVAGQSNFGQEQIFRTMGEAPRFAPELLSVRNGSAGCVDVEWKQPASPAGREMVGYRIMVHRVGTAAMREWYVRGMKQSLCSLPFYADFVLNIEADNGFGYSPSATLPFRTDQGPPSGPPEDIVLKPLSSTSIAVTWREPSVPNGVVTSYQIYYRELKSLKPYAVIRLVVGAKPAKSFLYNVTKLTPRTTYKFRLSASTSKGEGEKSASIQTTTDFAAPAPPVITNISYSCGETVSVAWEPVEATGHYRVLVESRTSAVYNTSLPHLEIGRILPNQRYSIRVLAAQQSAYGNHTLLESPYSKHEVFTVIPDKCRIRSSICPPFAAGCEAIAAISQTGPRSAPTIAPYFVALVAMVSILAAFMFYFRKRCVFVKAYLKKTRKIRSHETVSLVYDANDGIRGETVPLSRFDEYYKELARNNNEGFRRQFVEVEAESGAVDEEEPEEGEDSAEIRLKNRYLNIGAVGRTRIRIRTEVDDGGYINANCIDSCDEKNAYIATQAPLPHTFGDFWAMVWQEKCNLIVVITNLVESGRRKCDQYWPSKPASTLSFGCLQVAMTHEMPNANFVHRILTLKANNCNQPERTVHQVHFTSWPDHGVPNTVFPLLSFINYVADIQSVGPVVVHCSAGVGRSGSFILIDSMRRHLLKCDRLNVQAHLKHIRQQRAHLVQTLDQYVFCHDAIRQLILHGIARQPIINFVHYVQFLQGQRLLDGRTRMQLQFEAICNCPHNPRCAPNTSHVVLPGYHRAREFVIGCWDSACPEFWSTVWKLSCQTVVFLGTEDDMSRYFHDNEVKMNETSHPSLNGHGPMKPGVYVEQQTDGNAILRCGEDELCVRTVVLSRHSFENDTWGEIERIQDEAIDYHSKQIMFLDPQTTSTPYIFCVLQSAACQLEQERFVDVLQFLATYRFARCGCWTSQKDIEFVYDKILELIQMQRV